MSQIIFYWRLTSCESRSLFTLSFCAFVCMQIAKALWTRPTTGLIGIKFRGWFSKTRGSCKINLISKLLFPAALQAPLILSFRCSIHAFVFLFFNLWNLFLRVCAQKRMMSISPLLPPPPPPCATIYSKHGNCKG